MASLTVYGILIKTKLTSVNVHICVEVLLLSGFFNVRGAYFPGCGAITLVSKTKLLDDDDDLRGSRGTIDPSCSNIPAPVILHSCDLLPIAW